ncbi:MAG TPA: phosphate ABC transporter substrate-binding protein [Spongiibacteraceae bacterium]|jgi:ABC-type phosphate transport system substrate-binding protein
MRISKYVTRAIIGCALGLSANIALAEVVVVVSAKSAAGTLTSSQVADIFLGKSATFPSGGKVTPIDQSEGSAGRDEFYTKVAGKSAAQVKAYWSKIIFSGKGQPPKEAGDSAAVKKAVAGNPESIGYIDKAAVDSSVKIVFAN